MPIPTSKNDQPTPEQIEVRQAVARNLAAAKKAADDADAARAAARFDPAVSRRRFFRSF